MKNDRVGIVAVAQTELRPAWNNAQHIDLISAVVSEVFKGVGLTLDDVDFVIDSGSDVLDGRSISNCGFLGAMGAHHKEESRVEEDGIWSAQYGALKIAAGGADVGLIIAYSKPSESDVRAFYATQCEPFYQRPVGFDHLAASGIQAQRYIAETGIGQDALADLVSKRWQAAKQKGGVQIDKVPSPSEILASPMAARPLTEAMMARPVDGAVAMLIASERVAHRISPNPVWITGMGHSTDRHAFASRKANALEACEVAGRMATERAGIKASEVSLAEVSASSVVTELMVIEALGLAEKGKGAAATVDSNMVINASGGALPADPIMSTGLVRLAHAAQQLARPGTYGLKTPRSALAHGAGGVGMQAHCVLVLEV
jgi:acetyl-CoA C-acetyltransferase